MNTFRTTGSRHADLGGSFTRWRSLAALVLGAAVFAVSSEAEATELPIAVGEVTPPPASSGVDASQLRDTAEGEIRQIDASQIPDRRRVVVSLALLRAATTSTVACTVNAMLRDAKTGTMIAIIEGGAHADGVPSAELSKQVAYAAVRSAMRRIPGALGAK